MSQAVARKTQVTPEQDKPLKARPKLKLVPVLKLGVGKEMLERGPAPVLCRASAGGSCDTDCTTCSGTTTVP